MKVEDIPIGVVVTKLTPPDVVIVSVVDNNTPAVVVESAPEVTTDN